MNKLIHRAVSLLLLVPLLLDPVLACGIHVQPAPIPRPSALLIEEAFSPALADILHPFSHIKERLIASLGREPSIYEMNGALVSSLVEPITMSPDMRSRMLIKFRIGKAVSPTGMKDLEWIANLVKVFGSQVVYDEQLFVSGHTATTVVRSLVHNIAPVYLKQDENQGIGWGMERYRTFFQVAVPGEIYESLREPLNEFMTRLRFVLPRNNAALVLDRILFRVLEAAIEIEGSEIVSFLGDVTGIIGEVRANPKRFDKHLEQLALSRRNDNPDKAAAEINPTLNAIVELDPAMKTTLAYLKKPGGVQNLLKLQKSISPNGEMPMSILLKMLWYMHRNGAVPLLLQTFVERSSRNRLVDEPTVAQFNKLFQHGNYRRIREQLPHYEAFISGLRRTPHFEEWDGFDVISRLWQAHQQAVIYKPVQAYFSEPDYYKDLWSAVQQKKILWDSDDYLNGYYQYSFTKLIIEGMTVAAFSKLKFLDRRPNTKKVQDHLYKGLYKFGLLRAG